MSNSALSQVHGGLSALLGLLLAWTTWNYGIRTQSGNRWLAGLQFTLWAAIPGLFYLGGPISRSILGLPDPLYGSSLAEASLGALGLWILGSIVLYPVGVMRATNTVAHSVRTVRRPTLSSADRVRAWKWFNHAGLWAFSIVSVALVVILTDEFEHEFAWSVPIGVALILVVQLRALFWTARWVSETKPHANWHWAKLVIIWVAAAATIRLAYVQIDYEWLPVMLLGGGLALALCLAITWTWLSARENSTKKAT